MIEIQNLNKNYRTQKVLSQVGLKIPNSCLFALLGPNGSGKTTLLKSILGIVLPTPGGKILLEGVSILGTKDYKDRTGYMSQAPKFPPHLKVCELMQLFARLRQQKPVYQESLLQDLNITPFWGKAIGELSGGMLQKVNILQCFMFENALYILDEPTSGLDPHTAFYLKQLLRKKKDQGHTLVFTSHIMSEVEELADLLALLVEGKVYTVTSPKELKQQRNNRNLEEALHQFWDSKKEYEKIST